MPRPMNRGQVRAARASGNLNAAQGRRLNQSASGSGSSSSSAGTGKDKSKRS